MRDYCCKCGRTVDGNSGYTKNGHTYCLSCNSDLRSENVGRRGWRE